MNNAVCLEDILVFVFIDGAGEERWGPTVGFHRKVGDPEEISIGGDRSCLMFGWVKRRDDVKAKSQLNEEVLENSKRQDLEVAGEEYQRLVELVEEQVYRLSIT